MLKQWIVHFHHRFYRGPNVTNIAYLVPIMTFIANILAPPPIQEPVLHKRMSLMRLCSIATFYSQIINFVYHEIAGSKNVWNINLIIQHWFTSSDHKIHLN